ncbi:expressed unknown protein [Seminavis robusta]|uniref:Glycosyl transferase 64 domain-containing protein n=1 Tax=Seminavis robusta TaxID=568900 RepID=A0A9N8F3X9_9STRA|nr:expressed unknown protein [Seminavis robusta]|eukprot:Sro3151_g344490.1 n/a (379) ;mRNA; r:6750-7886
MRRSTPSTTGSSHQTSLDQEEPQSLIVPNARRREISRSTHGWIAVAFAVVCVWTLGWETAPTTIATGSEIKAIDVLNVTAVLVLHGTATSISQKKNLDRLLPTLLDREEIQQVILLPIDDTTTTTTTTTNRSSPSYMTHENPKVEVFHPKPVQLQRMGTSTRFWVAGYKSHHPYVLVMDAHSIQRIGNSALDQLFREYKTNPYRIVGLQGRSHSSFWGMLTHGYTSTPTNGPTEVILGSLALMEKELCHNFHLRSHVLDNQYHAHTSTVDADDQQESSSILLPPDAQNLKWNWADDVFMSLVANFLYGSDAYPEPIRSWANAGRNNYAMPGLDVTLSASANKQKWAPSDATIRADWTYRGKLWNLAVKNLHTYSIRGD